MDGSIVVRLIDEERTGLTVIRIKTAHLKTRVQVRTEVNIVHEALIFGAIWVVCCAAYVLRSIAVNDGRRPAGGIWGVR
jgi:hypothetical protein